MTQAPSRGVNTDVVIIGGGLAGLACAVGLRGSGLKVMVIEGSGYLGGRARSWVDRTTGDTVDIGPHVFCTTYRNMFKFLDLLGTRDWIAWHKDKLITLIDSQRPVVLRTYPLPAPWHFAPGFRDVLRRATISSQDLRSNRTVSRVAMTLSEQELLKLDDMNAADFLRHHGVTQRFADWFWASVSMSITNVPLQQCSAGALLRFYQMLIGNRGFHFGFAKEGLSDLFAARASRLIHAGGGKIVMNAEVKQFMSVDGVVTGVTLSDNTRINARWCISAVPPQNLRAIVSEDWAQRHEVFGQLKDFQPNPYISVYIWFAEKLSREQFWARLWSPKNLNYDYYDLSNIRAGWADRPSVIASNMIYSHRANSMTDAEIVDATVREVSEFMPEAPRTKIVHSVVNRIPMAIPCPFPGTEKKRPSTQTPIRGLLLAGDWLNTGLPACMDSAVRSGWLAAEQVWRDLGAPIRLAVPVRHLRGIPGLVQRVSRLG